MAAGADAVAQSVPDADGPWKEGAELVGTSNYRQPCSDISPESALRSCGEQRLGEKRVTADTNPAGPLTVAEICYKIATSPLVKSRPKTTS